MLIEVKRQWFTDHSVISKCYVDGIQECFILERPDLNNQREISCIPEGRYGIGLHDSPHFKRVLPHVLNVPDREDILIHPANYPSELKGCLAPGTTMSQDAVFNSKLAFGHLWDKIQQAMKNAEKVEIEISHV